MGDMKTSDEKELIREESKENLPHFRSILSYWLYKGVGYRYQLDLEVPRCRLSKMISQLH
jgi:hypothetical protein